MNKRNIKFTLLLFYFSLLLLPKYAIAVKIRFATLAPEGSAWMKTMHELDEELNEATSGEISFKFYPNMSMGDERDVIRKMRLGQINAAGFTGFGLGEILPEIRILELPYIFNDLGELDTVRYALTGYFREKLAEKGFILLGWADVGWVYFLSNKPVAEPQHLDGLKVWMWEGDPLAKAFFAELNQSPVPLPITDVHLSLQTGLIDAVYCSPLAALALQWFTKVKYVSDIPFTNAIGAVLMDKPTFDKLEKPLQEQLLMKSEYYLQTLLTRSRVDNHESYQQLLKEGLQVVNSTDAQRDLMEGIGENVQNKLKNSLYPEELLLKMNAILSEYRNNQATQR